MSAEVMIALGLVAIVPYLLVVRRRGAGTSKYVHIEKLRQVVFSNYGGAEALQRLGPMIEELRQKFGDRIPVSEADHFFSERIANCQKQMEEIVQVGRAEGKTVELEKLRQDVKAAAYKGNAPDAVHREIDQHIDAMKAQYGDRMPVDDAFRLMQKFERETGQIP